MSERERGNALCLHVCVSVCERECFDIWNCVRCILHMCAVHTHKYRIHIALTYCISRTHTRAHHVHICACDTLTHTRTDTHMFYRKQLQTCIVPSNLYYA